MKIHELNKGDIVEVLLRDEPAPLAATVAAVFSFAGGEVIFDLAVARGNGDKQVRLSGADVELGLVRRPVAATASAISAPAAASWKIGDLVQVDPTGCGDWSFGVIYGTGRGLKVKVTDNTDPDDGVVYAVAAGDAATRVRARPPAVPDFLDLEALREQVHGTSGVRAVEVLARMINDAMRARDEH